MDAFQPVPFTPIEICYASGLSPQGTRTKRYNGSTTDEDPGNQSDGFVECDMRAGGPYLPDLPWETSKLPLDHPLHEASGSDISHAVPDAVRNICTDEGLDVHNIDIFDCFYFYAEGKTPTTAMRIVVQGENSRRKWMAVACMVHKHLIDNSSTDTGVEISAKALEEGWRLFSTLENDEICPIWDEVVYIASIACVREYLSG